MNQGIILYLLVALVTHVAIVMGMAILLTIAHSVYATMKKGISGQATSTVFKRQIASLFIIITISMLVGSLPLLVSQQAADFFYRAALLTDIIGPFLVFLLTLHGLKTAKTEAKLQEAH